MARPIESHPLLALPASERQRIERRALGIQALLVAFFASACAFGWFELAGTYGVVAVTVVVAVQAVVCAYVVRHRLQGRAVAIPEVVVPLVGVVTVTLAWTAMADPTSPTWAVYMLALVGYSGRLGTSDWRKVFAWTLMNAAAGIAVFAVRDPSGHVVTRAPEMLFYIVAAGLVSKMINMAWSQAEGTAREQASSDPLTGLANRRMVFTRLDDLCSSGDAVLSLLMVDLDDFKRLNDRAGHSAGDRALVEVARVLRETVRGGDMVGRYGGEEFVIALPRATVDEAAVSAERIRRAIEAAGAVTVSIGVAEREHGESPAALIDRADAELLRAKRQGKNRLSVAAVHRRAA